MAETKTCDICGLEKAAFTDNTTKTVTFNSKETGFFIQISLAPPRPDTCNECFALLLVKLGKLLKTA